MFNGTYNGKMLVLVVSMIALVFASGCGKDEVIPPSAESVKAERAVETLKKMEAAYKARDMKSVLDSVSPDFKGGLSSLESSVRKDMDMFPKVVLEITIDRVVESGNDVSVAFHWYGRWSDKNGRVNEGRGNSVFTFTDMGSMRLASVTGDNPFAVVR